MNHPPVHPQPSNHTPVETENPVRHPHPLQGYNHTPVETENPVRHFHPLQGYNHKEQNGQQPNKRHGVHLNSAVQLSKEWGPPLLYPLCHTLLMNRGQRKSL